MFVYKFIHLLSVFLISFVLGLMIVFLPVKLLFSFIIILSLVVLVFFQPWMVFVMVLGLVSGLDLPGFIPVFGAVRLSDIFLLLSVLFFILFFRENFQKNSKSIEPVAIPCFMYVLVVIASCFVAYVFFGTELRQIFGELKHQLYWLLLPMFAVMVVENGVYKKTLILMLVIGLIASMLQIIQGIFGVQLSSSVGTYQVAGIGGDSVLRTNIGKFIIIWTFLLLCSALFFRYISSRVALLPLVLTILGVLVTYGKSLWAGVFLAFIFLFIQFNIKDQVVSVSKLLFIFLLLVIFVFLIKPEVFTSVIDRVMSVGEEIDSGYSLQWRIYENERAIESIMNYPLGVGLGSAYRPQSVVDINVSDMVRYIHNSYYYMAVKLSGIGLFLFFLVMFRIAMLSVRFRKKLNAIAHKNQYNKFDIVIVSIYPPLLVGMLLYSIFTPSLMTSDGIAFLAVFSGIVLGRVWAFDGSKS